MAKYLATGASGFIASKVCELLLGEGHQVVGLDNLNDAYDVRLKEWRLKQLQVHPGFEFHRLDITHRAGLKALFVTHAVHPGEPPWPAVLHLAARAGVRQSVENPWAYYETNVTGTLNLLELCREFGVKKFVLASTSSAYGENTPVPFREDAPTDHPLSPYAASKKAAEVLCSTYHFLYGIDVSVLRYFTVYGPAGRPDMSLFRFVQWIAEGKPLQVFGDGSQSRDFTFVEDVARGTVAALKPLSYEIINLGSDQPVVLLEAIRKVEDLLEAKARIDYQPRHQADVAKTWASIEKAERLLGWRPQVSFSEGLSRLVEWYMSNRNWASQIHT